MFPRALGLSFAHALSLACFVVAAGAVTGSALDTPEWNFDAVEYVGAASSGTPAEVQRQAYASIEAAAPAPQAQAIASASEYRRRMSTDADAFVAELPIYRFKWGYVALVSAAHRLGCNAANATHWVSTAAYAALALALLGWLLRQRVAAPVVLVSAALIAAPPLGELAALSTPDMLVVFLLGVGAAAVVDEDARWRRAGLIALALTGVVRPDAALNTVVVLGALAWAEPSLRRPAVAGAVVAGLMAMAGAAASGPSAVLRLIGLNFTSRSYAAATPLSGLQAYLHALWFGLHGTALYRPSVVALWGVGGLVAGLGLGRAQTGRARRLQAVLLGAWVTLPLRFLLFPDRSDRFLAPTYAVTGFALLVALVALFEAQPKGQRVLTDNGH